MVCAVEAVFRGKCIALNQYIGEEKFSTLVITGFHLTKLENKRAN